MQAFRDLVHGYFGKAVLAVVIALFVLYGTEALVSLAGQPTPVAKVNDASLFREQLTGMVSQQKQAILRQNPGLPADFIKDDYLRSQVAQRWVERQLIDQALSEWGVRPDQKTVVAQLQADSRFAADGVVQQDALEGWLKANGLSPQDLFQDIRTNLGLDQLITGLETSEFLVPKQIAQVHDLQAQTRDFKVARISPDQLMAEVELDEARLQAYYNAHLNDYMQPESAQVSYLLLDETALTKDIDVAASDASLQGYYETYKQNLKQDEKRQAAHILIDTSNRSDEEALEIASSVMKKLAEGSEFGALALEYSDDKPSAEDGGSLPLAERGTYVPEFEQALYALELEQVSDPVKTDFGYHIIRLNSIEAKEPESFASKKAELEQQYADAQRMEAFRSLLDEAALIAFESSNLEELAARFDLTVVTSKPFNRQMAPAPLNSKKVIDAIFADDFFEAGRNSDIIELEDQAIVLFPQDYKAAEPKAFEVVKSEVTKAAELEEAKALAQERGRELIAKLKLEQPLTDDEAKLLGDWTEFALVDRRSAEVSASIIQELFAMKKPKDKSVFSGVVDNADFVVVQLEKINPLALDKNMDAKAAAEAEIETLTAQLQESAARGVTVLLVDALKDSADIEYGPQLIGEL